MTEEHQALREAVRGLLSGYPTRAALSAPAGYDAALWRRLCGEIGVGGLAVPAEYGGSGASLLEACVVLEELGRSLTPSPMLGVLLAGQALLANGDAGACAGLLPAMCAGDRVVAVTWDGTVTDSGSVDTLLVVADGTLFEVDAGALRHVPSLDLTRRLATVDVPGEAAAGTAQRPAGAGQRSAGAELAGSRVGAAGSAAGASGAVLGAVDVGWLRDVACVALSAEQVGAAARALELTVEYARTRVQFGRPIGSFQVLQHRMAESHVLVEAARSASWTAAEALVAGAPEAGRLAAVAKVWCSETLRTVAADMVQAHGGIAITWEHDAHLYLRRAWASAQLFGSPEDHVDRVAADLGLDLTSGRSR
ncbi:acyl-CoA dehydrogenase family protein [Actinoplanes sp. DH11]|uniref:acyl-CoA dehydrogenase family protein n=1 Tax=Actinoplanes sp. DH11 TaxID=2857011 RepID=UPI001E2FC38B|nr:acyl-CoA dehydrogenase family protein [Actinoplanes sp. DH11]